MLKRILIILSMIFVFCFYNLYSEGDKNSTLTVDNVIYWLEYYQIKHIDIVIRQILLETNYFTSDICQNNNNLFGMRLPSKRETTAVGKRKGYAIYEGWISSIEDFKLWQENWKVKDNTDYIKLLIRVGYAEDQSYIDKIKKITL